MREEEKFWKDSLGEIKNEKPLLSKDFTEKVMLKAQAQKRIAYQPIISNRILKLILGAFVCILVVALGWSADNSSSSLSEFYQYIPSYQELQPFYYALMIGSVTVYLLFLWDQLLKKWFAFK